MTYPNIYDRPISEQTEQDATFAMNMDEIKNRFALFVGMPPGILIDYFSGDMEELNLFLKQKGLEGIKNDPCGVTIGIHGDLPRPLIFVDRYIKREVNTIFQNKRISIGDDRKERTQLQCLDVAVEEVIHGVHGCYSLRNEQHISLELMEFQVALCKYKIFHLDPLYKLLTDSQRSILLHEMTLFGANPNTEKTEQNLTYRVGHKMALKVLEKHSQNPDYSQFIKHLLICTEQSDFINTVFGTDKNDGLINYQEFVSDVRYDLKDDELRRLSEICGADYLSMLKRCEPANKNSQRALLRREYSDPWSSLAQNINMSSRSPMDLEDLKKRMRRARDVKV